MMPINPYQPPGTQTSGEPEPDYSRAFRAWRFLIFLIAVIGIGWRHLVRFIEWIANNL